jgi:hypothetical protein
VRRERRPPHARAGTDLGDVAANLVHERRIRLHDSDVAEVFEGAEVLFLFAFLPVDGEGPAIVSLEPAATEGEGTKGFVDVRQQLLGGRQPQGNLAHTQINQI